jgi:tetratricopeptide (TPR) repeat protein
MTSTIETIYNDFRSAKQFSNDYAIDFFETNPVSLSDFKTFKDRNDLKFFIELVWQYANALYLKNRYNDTIDKTIKYFPVIESEVERVGDRTLKDDWYYGILFLKGMASYNLRDYKASTPIFKQLVARDPKNENYQKWLNYSLYGQRMWISKTIVIVCCALIAIEIFFGKYVPSIARMSLDGIALLGLIGTGVYDYYIKRSRRKSSLK